MMTQMGTELELISNRIKRGIRNGKYTLGEIKTSLSQKARRAASQTDYFVHENAWTIIGATAGMALLTGFLLRRKRTAVVPPVISEPPPDLSLKQKTSISVPEIIQCAIPLAILLLRVTRSRRFKA